MLPMAANGDWIVMQALMDINGECRRQYEVFFRIFVCNYVQSIVSCCPDCLVHKSI
jgi:hypothetical protein